MKKFICLCSTILAASPAYCEENSHCGKSEEIVFNCVAQEKIISVCSAKSSDKPEIEYRYGKKNLIEMKYSANNKNKNKFYANSEPVNPRANVKELWFERDEFKYLLTSCTGGDCGPYAGLIVYKNDNVISKKTCKYDPSGYAWFNLPSVDFSEKQSKSPFVEFKDDYFDLTPLFPLDVGKY